MTTFLKPEDAATCHETGSWWYNISIFQSVISRSTSMGEVKLRQVPPYLFVFKNKTQINIHISRNINHKLLKCWTIAFSTFANVKLKTISQSKLPTMEPAFMKAMKSSYELFRLTINARPWVSVNCHSSIAMSETSFLTHQSNPP